MGESRSPQFQYEHCVLRLLKDDPYTTLTHSLTEEEKEESRRRWQERRRKRKKKRKRKRKISYRTLVMYAG